MKPGAQTPARRGAGGFTLIELLLAIALLSVMLVALFTFVFSMGEIWGQGSERRLFQQHVNAVTRHLEALLRAGAAPLVTPVGTGEPYSVREVRGPDGQTQPLLTFTLPEGDRRFRWPGPALPEVTCSLGSTPGQGLILYWQSALELDRESEPPRTVLVSTFVTKMEYLIYQADTNSWRTEPQLRRGPDNHWVLPDRIRLTYTYRALTAVRELTLPAKAGGVPAY